MASKFLNKSIEIDGYRFDSLKEGRRYGDLKMLERAGRITDLKIHPAYPLDVNGYPICRYEADFSYVENGASVVEDVKSAHTRKLPVYQLKRKLMRAIHNIAIREV
jgi:hypothetical protein